MNMFRDGGFLIVALWLLLVIAAVIALIAGWLIWGRARDEAETGEDAAAQLATCRKLHDEKDVYIDRLEAELQDLRDGSGEKGTDAPPPPPPPRPKAPDPKPEPALTAAKPAPTDGQPVKPARPAQLTRARDGAPDDLTQIKGIGAKLEALCHDLGFYHFDQIAAWTANEVAWVDSNLDGFHGRVSRDDWVRQAKALMAAK